MTERSRSSRRLPSLPSPDPPGGKLSIGPLSRAAGIPMETLRTWEARYGFPAPDRRPSGHRVYPLACLPRLRRIAEALARGHRAAQVVPASDAELDALLGAMPLPRNPPPAPTAELDRGPIALRAIVDFDAAALTRLAQAQYARLGPLTFLTAVVAPLLRAVGEAWAQGRLEVRHEHFLSERLTDLLRTLRLPFEERATGPLVVLATLPGEAHGLGLQMAGLVLAAAGCRLLSLGTDLPVAQIAGVSAQQGARAVAISISAASRGGKTARHLATLRRLLPRHVSLLVGGEGSPGPRPGIEVLPDLPALDAWARRAALAG